MDCRVKTNYKLKMKKINKKLINSNTCDSFYIQMGKLLWNLEKYEWYKCKKKSNWHSVLWRIIVTKTIIDPVSCYMVQRPRY